MSSPKPESNSGDNKDDVEENISTTCKKKKPMLMLPNEGFIDVSSKCSSEVWKHFKKNKAVNKALCNHCNLVMASNQGTTSLNNHLKSHNKYLLLFLFIKLSQLITVNYLLIYNTIVKSFYPFIHILHKCLVMER